MQSFHETGHFSAVAVDLFRAAQRVVELIPDPEPHEEPWRCHEVARVVADALGLDVVDGVCGCVDHSWIVIPNGGADGDAILDVYAAGVLPQVLLIDTFYGLPAEKSFKPRERREDVRLSAIARMKSGLVAAEAMAR